jgi:HEAT repeat protein
MTAFQSCVTGTGTAYTTARNELLAEGETIVSTLEAETTSTDWQTRTVAQILLGWIQHRDLFEQVNAVLKSGTAPKQPRSPALVAETLACLGSETVPRLLEILTKTDEPRQPIVLRALALLRDPRGAPPLLELLGRTRDSARRVQILATLGAIGDPVAFDDARELLLDDDQSPAVRGAAALCLGSLGDQRAAGHLMASAAASPPMLRGAAYRALGFMDEIPDEGDLADRLADEADELAALELVGTLAQVAARIEPFAVSPAVDALSRAAHDHASAAVRRAALNAVRGGLS